MIQNNSNHQKQSSVQERRIFTEALFNSLIPFRILAYAAAPILFIVFGLTTFIGCIIAFLFFIFIVPAVCGIALANIHPSFYAIFSNGYVLIGLVFLTHFIANIGEIYGRGLGDGKLSIKDNAFLRCFVLTVCFLAYLIVSSAYLFVEKQADLFNSHYSDSVSVNVNPEEMPSRLKMIKLISDL
ncbi:hypothetical protein GHO45_11060 [Pseudomonas sp. FSL R10-0765]|uniref:hypothetical protein n=1 Tax=Pseudomonas sp. FSL R10-0765 TaxID=2662195 RepID=UPI0012954FE9|nr:hypothetical protein [Pseudomonas sp. FSL R10-0765]MQT41463.1 hypothetical protein [Pseudomonas sp. FSL R10-0765]